MPVLPHVSPLAPQGGDSSWTPPREGINAAGGSREMLGLHTLNPRITLCWQGGWGERRGDPCSPHPNSPRTPKILPRARGTPLLPPPQHPTLSWGQARGSGGVRGIQG